MKDKIINYNFFHWGPFLYKTKMTNEEVNQIKNLCSKKNKDVRDMLAGIMKHEHKLDHKKVFPVILPYLESYVKAYFDYRAIPMGNKIELVSSWVNYMAKNESNPLHTHDGVLSFVLFLEIPKKLLEEYNQHVGRSIPGSINFVYTLNNRPELISEHSFFPEVGDLFIFPACLSHYVNSFQSDGERISVSGNIEVSNG